MRKSEKILTKLIHIQQQVDNVNHYPTSNSGASSVDQGAMNKRRDSVDNANELITPPFRTAPDTILEWPILRATHDYDSGYISDALFEQSFLHTNPYLQDENEPELFRLLATAIVQDEERPGLVGLHLAGAAVDEEAVPRLVGIYLAKFHVISPVVDITLARTWAMRVSAEGCRWDGPTCLTVRKYSVLVERC